MVPNRFPVSQADEDYNQFIYIQYPLLLAKTLTWFVLLKFGK